MNKHLQFNTKHFQTELGTTTKQPLAPAVLTEY
jgi:hypothetical protein